jgi:hypothetical protein
MAQTDNLTPGKLVTKIRENQNKNGTIKALFANQFLSKFTLKELEGIVKSCEKEIKKREEEKVNELTRFLEQKGYEVKKK